MDPLQIALIFLIVLLGVFLTILGVEAFLILRELRKDLDKLGKFIGELGEGATKQTIQEVKEKIKAPKRFFKKSL